MSRIAWTLALALASGGTAAAQDLNCPPPPPQSACTTPARTYQDQFCRVVEIIAADSSRRSTAKQACIEQQVDVAGRNLKAFLLYAQARSKAIDVSTIEGIRTDKQVGAPGNGAGSGSAVSKGSVPAVLGFAVENGALTQENGDTTVTLRGNLVGWLDLIQSQGFIDAYQDDSPIVRQLRRVSYSLTLNTDSTAAASASGLSPNALLDQVRQTKQQLAGYSARVAIVDKRDPRTFDNRLALTTLLGRQMDAALEADDFLGAVFNDRTYYDEGWVKETAALLGDPGLGAPGVERMLYRRLEVLRVYMRDHIDNFDERVTRAIMALEGFDKARLKVFQAMQKKPLVAFEYLNVRDTQLPDTQTLRLIYERQVGPRADLTANASTSLQKSGTSTATGATITGGVRDIQVAVQLDVPLASAAKALSSTGGIGTPVFAVAYLFEQLKEKAAIKFAGNTFNAEPGAIHLLQAKLSIPVKGSGIKIPLSLSYSNRTDLVREKTIRGHVGITFDLDVLSALRP